MKVNSRTALAADRYCLLASCAWTAVVESASSCSPAYSSFLSQLRLWRGLEAEASPMWKRTPLAGLLEAWPVAAPVAGRLPAKCFLSSLVDSADADPRVSRIIIQFHFLDALVLMLALRRLMLGGEECFFTDVFVLAFMVRERLCSSWSSATATILAAPPPVPPGQRARPSVTVTWPRAERDLAGGSLAPAQQPRALGPVVNYGRSASSIHGHQRHAQLAAPSLRGVAVWPQGPIADAFARAGRTRLPALSSNGLLNAALLWATSTRSRREAEEEIQVRATMKDRKCRMRRR